MGIEVPLTLSHYTQATISQNLQTDVRSILTVSNLFRYLGRANTTEMVESHMAVMNCFSMISQDYGWIQQVPEVA